MVYGLMTLERVKEAHCTALYQFLGSTPTNTCRSSICMSLNLLVANVVLGLGHWTLDLLTGKFWFQFFFFFCRKSQASQNVIQQATTKSWQRISPFFTWTRTRCISNFLHEYSWYVLIFLKFYVAYMKTKTSKII